MAMGLSGGGSGGGRGRRRGRSRATPMSEINVTPLVDVMLVLLIIFMVTAPLMNSGVEVNLPETNAEPLAQPNQEPVQISITRDGGVYIDDVPVSMSELPQRLAAIAEEQKNDERSVMLRADQGLDYGLVMRVMGEMNHAGLNKVQMVTTGASGAAPANAGAEAAAAGAGPSTAGSSTDR